MRRRPLIPQRRLVFIGCEGESEAGYARGLEDLANQAGSHMALQVAVLDKGHALARIESAKRKVLKLRQSRQLRFEAQFLMLDTDEFEKQPAGLAKANRFAKQNGFQVIWQEPCFEALLLRHFRDSRPPTSRLAFESLQREWPGYQKGMTRMEFSRKIDWDEVRQAARLEPGLAQLLRVMGLLE